MAWLVKLLLNQPNKFEFVVGPDKKNINLTLQAK